MSGGRPYMAAACEGVICEVWESSVYVVLLKTEKAYNTLCFTSVACSVAKLRAPPFPLRGRKIGIM